MIWVVLAASAAVVLLGFWLSVVRSFPSEEDILNAEIDRMIEQNRELRSNLDTARAERDALNESLRRAHQVIDDCIGDLSE